MRSFVSDETFNSKHHHKKYLQGRKRNYKRKRKKKTGSIAELTVQNIIYELNVSRQLLTILYITALKRSTGAPNINFRNISVRKTN